MLRRCVHKARQRLLDLFSKIFAMFLDKVIFFYSCHDFIQNVYFRATGHPSNAQTDTWTQVLLRRHNHWATTWLRTYTIKRDTIPVSIVVVFRPYTRRRPLLTMRNVTCTSPTCSKQKKPTAAPSSLRHCTGPPPGLHSSTARRTACWGLAAITRHFQAGTTPLAESGTFLPAIGSVRPRLSSCGRLPPSHVSWHYIFFFPPSEVVQAVTWRPFNSHTIRSRLERCQCFPVGADFGMQPDSCSSSPGTDTWYVQWPTSIAKKSWVSDFCVLAVQIGTNFPRRPSAIGELE